MTSRDIFVLAIQNLWTRKLRTLLNLLGVTVSCCLLLMTLAGTRGAAEGMVNMINGSAHARQLLLYSWTKRDIKVPDEVLATPGGIEAKRTKRLKNNLRDQWLGRNAKRVYLTKDVLAEVRSIENLESLVPQGNFGCDVFDGPQKVRGTTIGFDVGNSNYADRLIAGTVPADDDAVGILLDEFTAFQMGYKTDQQLKALIGKKIRADYLLGKQQLPSRANAASLLKALGGQAEIANLPELISAVQELTQQLDATDLTPRQKELLRETLKSLAPAGDASTEKQATDKDASESVDSGENPNGSRVFVKDDGQKILQREFVVRGLIQQPLDDESLPFLSFIPSSSKASLYVPGRQLERIHFQRDNFNGFTSAIAAVKDAAALREVVDELERVGFRTRSALPFVEKIGEEISKARLAAAALALLILVIAAIGISNTMIIAVLERTPEFGIMKSLGTRDGQVLGLVLLEGLITGLLGAALAVGLSTVGSAWVTNAARTYIEGRIRTDFNQPIFLFSWQDFVITFMIATVVCTIASLLPAWRAARLDPVVAMHRK